MKKPHVFIVLFLFFLQLVFPQKSTNKRAEWFVKDRFGMFIHWGIYSGAEGIWKGERLRNANNYAEWIQYRNSIAKEEYLTLLKRFNWDKIDVESWVKLAKASGMRYITVTAKHHDGFAMWNSDVGDYDLGNFIERDIIKELSESCKKHDIKLGFYYSHWVDWEHEHGWDHAKELTGISPKAYDTYWQEKVIPQVTELLTNYGDIAMMWFDMWIHHSKSCVTGEQLLQLKSLIRELQPNCLINSRLGLSVEEDGDIDFQTLGDNELGLEKKDFPWQSPGTVAHSWGYNAFETNYKSTSFLLQALIGNVSLNGNYLLNIGPNAHGEVPHEINSRLLEMGRWLEMYGESIYDTEAVDLRKDSHQWGRITQNRKKNTIYLHIFNWPLSRALNFTGVTNKPSKIYVLGKNGGKTLPFEHMGAFTKIRLPEQPPDPYVSVIAIEYKDRPNFRKGLVAQNNRGGYSLNPLNQIEQTELKGFQGQSKEGTVPKHMNISGNSSFKWHIYIEEEAQKRLDLSYFSDSEKNQSKITVRVDGKQLLSYPRYTGFTVGEPNKDWKIPKFKSHTLGTAQFTKGYHEVELSFEMEENHKTKFQWLWIE